MASSLESAISELLLRNGLVGVDKTSRAATKLLMEFPDAIFEVSRLARTVDREMCVIGRVSKKEVATLIQAQLPKSALAATTDLTTVEASVFVATDLEFQSVRAALSGVIEALDKDGNWIARGVTSGGHRVSLVKTGLGNVASGAISSAVLNLLRPKLAIFCGIAGGLHDQSPGSVVLASRVHDYESAEDGVTRGSRAQSLEVPHRVQQVSGALVRAGVAKVRAISVRPIASGEKLVTSSYSPTAEWLKIVASDAAAVEMEGLGLMRAAGNLGIPATVVRAVSDRKDDKSQTNDVKNQPIAARAAASAALALIDMYFKETEVS